MRLSISHAVLCCGLMLAGGAGLASAQSYYGGVYFGRYPTPRGPQLWDHVQDDLNRASYDVYGSDRHINHARKEVSDVQHQLWRGHFDRHEMGEAIDAVDHVLDRDRLPEDDRRILWNDLEAMRRFRDNAY
jgi:hypothetical protein